MKLTRPLVVFDLETTGTDKAKDRIVSLATCKILPNKGGVEAKTRILNPEIPIPKAASDVHGITDEMVKDQPTFAQFAKGLLAYIKDCDLAGFNILRFDVPLLYMEFFRAGHVWDYKSQHFVDVATIFIRQQPRTLAAALKHYTGKDIQNAHDAQADVMATLEVFMNQIKVHQDLPQDLPSLALYCNHDKPIVDLGGVFALDDQGDYILKIGKQKGEKAKNNKDFLGWMLKQDFLPDAKAIAESIINKA